MAGNPNIREAYMKSTGPKSEIGKFRSSINHAIGNKSNKYMARKVPKHLRDLYRFFKPFNTKEINNLIELKKLTEVLKTLSFPSIIERLEQGEVPSKREMDLLRLWKETLVDTHKLEFGDKRVIEHNVTVSDIRKQMMRGSVVESIDKKKYMAEAQQRFRNGKKLKEAEVIEGEFSQSFDSGGRGEDESGQDGSNRGDSEVSQDLQKSSEHSQD